MDKQNIKTRLIAEFDEKLRDSKPWKWKGDYGITDFSKDFITYCIDSVLNEVEKILKGNTCEQEGVED